VRFVNMLRKESGLTINDQVITYVETADEDVVATVKNFQDALSKDTLSAEIKLENTPEDLPVKEVSLGAGKTKLAIRKK